MLRGKIPHFRLTCVAQKRRCLSSLLIERLRFTFTPNGKREFVPRDQVFPYFPFTIYCFYTRISSFMPVLSVRIVLDCFYLLIYILRNSQLESDVCSLISLLYTHFHNKGFALSLVLEVRGVINSEMA